MNLLRDLPLLRLWRRLASRRRAGVVYTVTVPAPLAGAAEPDRAVPPLARVVHG